MDEYEKEIEEIRKLGLKDSPLRLAYEKEVHALRSVPQILASKGYSEEQIAQIMHEKRRELGRQYKDAAPPLFRKSFSLQLRQNTVIRLAQPMKCFGQRKPAGRS